MITPSRSLYQEAESSRRELDILRSENAKLNADCMSFQELIQQINSENDDFARLYDNRGKLLVALREELAELKKINKKLEEFALGTQPTEKSINELKDHLNKKD